MRLRSSQFVFLLLLVCSVQMREECTLQLAANAVSGRNGGLTPQRQNSPVTVSEIPPQGSWIVRVAVAMCLDSASLAVRRAPWPMQPAAREAASMSSHTSLLRA